MQRFEQKSDLTLTLLDEHVSHLFMGKDFKVEFHFTDKKSADSVVTALNNDKRLSTSLYSKLKSEHQTCHPNFKNNKCRVIQLNRNEFDALWGKGSYQLLFDMENRINAAASPQEFAVATKELADIAKTHTTLYQQMLRFRSYNKSFCGLRIALNNLTEDISTFFINSASASSLNHTIHLQDKDGETNMGFAMSYHSPDVCRKLISKISDAALRQSLFLLNNYNNCAFTLALMNQPHDICIQLINRLTKDTLNPALSNDGWSFVMTAAWCQSASVFTAIVKLTSPVPLAKAICQRHAKDKDSTIEIAAQYHTHDAFRQLLEHIDAFYARMHINTFFGQHSRNLINCFQKIALYQSAQNCMMFLNLLDSVRLDKLLEYCKSDIYQQNVRFALRALKYKLDKLEPRGDCTLLQPLIEFDAKEAAKKKEEKKSEPQTLHEQQALQKLKEGAFIKILRHEEKRDDHKKFMDHLADPTKRQIIREEKGIKKQGYKAQLRPGEIKESKTSPVYTFPGGFPTILRTRSPEERVLHKKQKPPYTLTTKHPVTYISCIRSIEV